MAETWKKAAEEICNTLEHRAEIEYTKKINNATAFRDGYVRACEDFFKEIRQVRIGESESE